MKKEIDAKPKTKPKGTYRNLGSYEDYLIRKIDKKLFYKKLKQHIK